jgi:hypothetical protein
MVNPNRHELASSVNNLQSELRAIKSNYKYSKSGSGKPVVRRNRGEQASQDMPHYQRLKFGQANKTLAKIKSSYSRSNEKSERERDDVLKQRRKIETGIRKAVQPEKSQDLKESK